MYRDIAITAAASAVAASICIMLTMPPLKNVETEKLTILDDSGRARITLGVDPGGGPKITLFGKSGKPQASFGVRDDDSAYLVLEHPTRSHVALDVHTDGALGISLSDPQGVDRAVLALAKDDDPTFTLVDGQTRRPRASITIDKGVGRLRLDDVAGKAAFAAP
jgi:hypothetical protein